MSTSSGGAPPMSADIRLNCGLTSQTNNVSQSVQLTGWLLDRNRSRVAVESL